MKKTGKMILAAFLAAAICTSVSAAESTAVPEVESVAEPAAVPKTEYAAMGMNIPLTQEMKDTKGAVLSYPLGPIDTDHHTYAMTFIYEGMPMEEARVKLYASNLTEEEMQEVLAKQGFITFILATESGFEEAKEAFDRNIGLPLRYDTAEEIGSADGFTFYSILSESESLLSAVDEEFAEEFKNLEQVILEAERNADFYEPEDQEKQMVGRKLEFTTTDLDGNTLTSEELFSANEITMLNCWGVWCPNCTMEMSELAEIHTRIQEKGCGIVGLEWEQDPSEKTYQEARTLMEGHGTNYPNVLMPDELISTITAYPTTIFVDKEGVILSVPIVGAQVSQYEAKLDELLAGMGTAPAEAAEPGDAAAEEVAAEAAESGDAAVEEAAAEPAAATYRIIVMDEEGPVEGVSVQFCDDSACRFGETDADGVAAFEAPAGDYEIHVVEVPDGYEENEESYATAPGSYEVSIQIVREE